MYNICTCVVHVVGHGHGGWRPRRELLAALPRNKTSPRQSSRKSRKPARYFQDRSTRHAHQNTRSTQQCATTSCSSSLAALRCSGSLAKCAMAARDLQTARRLPVCLSFSACCFLCFGLRAGPRGPYFESVCLFLCLFYGYCHAFRPPIAPGARELHISVWNPVLYLKYRGFPGARSTGRFYLFFYEYAGPGRRVSRAVCRRALATRDRERRVLEPKHGSRSREPNTLIVSSHVTAPLKHVTSQRPNYRTCNQKTYNMPPSAMSWVKCTLHHFELIHTICAPPWLTLPAQNPLECRHGWLRGTCTCTCTCTCT